MHYGRLEKIALRSMLSEVIRKLAEVYRRRLKVDVLRGVDYSGYGFLLLGPKLLNHTTCVCNNSLISFDLLFNLQWSSFTIQVSHVNTAYRLTRTIVSVSIKIEQPFVFEINLHMRMNRKRICVLWKFYGHSVYAELQMAL
ncbi:hypothetical protein TNCV_3713631 [Trichonephila clavipes]|nr:hypothetical protein TNCV_3713631 [Trichonephila clavipes]